MQVLSASRSEWIAPFTGLQPGQFHKLVRVLAERGGDAIVDGTLVPTRDHRLAARSKNYRYSTNLQVAIEADARLVIATGEPQPGNRNDCTVYRDSGVLDGRPVMADGGYQGNPEVIMPYRTPRDGSELADWQEDLNTVHRSVRARAEHALARMKNWTILRDHRRAAHTLRDTASAIARLHDLALTG
ncbi:transposase family protein [Umezawaea beigongshangensis]|uniref:transposase family protein n=1 Tax=Umezawaea beigongshangensis TaxID=2780383 RepID=UPI0018F26870|nr:transposase family protein [Umezawaea beigongshangensis]